MGNGSPAAHLGTRGGNRSAPPGDLQRRAVSPNYEEAMQRLGNTLARLDNEHRASASIIGRGWCRCSCGQLTQDWWRHRADMLMEIHGGAS